MGQQGTDRQIDNIEFAVADIARSKAFYGGAFGWSFTEYGPQYCEFTDGRLTGGLTTGTARPGGPLIILYADDLAKPKRGWKRSAPASRSKPFPSPAEDGFSSRIRMDTNWLCGQTNSL